MAIRAVTFDCEGTLLRVDWNPGRVLAEAARRCGTALPNEAEAKFNAMLSERRADYERVNFRGSSSVIDGFWIDLTKCWLLEIGVPAEPNPIWKQAKRLIFDPSQGIFKVFDDVLPCLEELESNGMRMAVISNWDASLKRVLASVKVDHYFQFVIASLSIGVEKPNPRIFLECAFAFGLAPDEMLHVGDRIADDVKGARGAGFHSVLIRRSGKPSSSVESIRSLGELPDWLKWNC